VNGNLNLSRALGDLHYKEPHLPPAEQTISGVPDTQSLSWKVGTDEFLLLGCDGVWECMSSQEAVSFVRSRLPAQGVKNKLVSVLGELLDACCASHPKQRGGLGCDNLTAVLVRFEDPEEVAAARARGAAGEPEAGQDGASEGRNSRQMDAAVSQVIQRLAAGKRRKPETAAEKQERLQREAEEREEAEAREKEERAQSEKRLARRRERELLESRTKKKVKFCAAAEDSEDAGDEDF